MSDTPDTDAAWADWTYAGPGVHANFARKLERERDEARKEIERLKAEAELYAGWSRWKDGIWRISHPDSGPLAEWIAEDLQSMKGVE
jgi:hypothetical protein